MSGHGAPRAALLWGALAALCVTPTLALGQDGGTVVAAEPAPTKAELRRIKRALATSGGDGAPDVASLDDERWRTPQGRRAFIEDLTDWFLDNGLFPQALHVVTKLRESGYDEPWLDLIQGRALSLQGLYTEAEAALMRAAAYEPTNPRPHAQLGVIHTDTGNLDAAIAAFTKALTLDGSDLEVRNNRGFVFLAARRCDEAVADLEIVVSRDGTVPRYRNNLAFALACNDELDRALGMFRSTGPEGDARYNLGVALERMDRLDDALTAYEGALVADPGHERARAARDRLRGEARAAVRLPPPAPADAADDPSAGPSASTSAAPWAGPPSGGADDATPPKATPAASSSSPSPLPGGSP